MKSACHGSSDAGQSTLLNVRGSLRIRGCAALAEIPENVVVAGDLLVVGRGRLRRNCPLLC